MMLPPHSSFDNRSESVDLALLKARRPQTVRTAPPVIPAILIILGSSLAGLSNQNLLTRKLKKQSWSGGASNPLRLHIYYVEMFHGFAYRSNARAAIYDTSVRRSKIVGDKSGQVKQVDAATRQRRTADAAAVQILNTVTVDSSK
jgi:hypothetical protein